MRKPNGSQGEVLIALYLDVLTFLTHWFKGAGLNCFPYKARNDHPVYLVQYYYKRNPKVTLLDSSISSKLSSKDHSLLIQCYYMRKTNSLFSLFCAVLGSNFR